MKFLYRIDKNTQEVLIITKVDKENCRAEENLFVEYNSLWYEWSVIGTLGVVSLGVSPFSIFSLYGMLIYLLQIMIFYYRSDNIIGAAQLCNKKGSTHFTSLDEDIARALSAYCCISIVHVSSSLCVV